MRPKDTRLAPSSLSHPHEGKEQDQHGSPCNQQPPGNEDGSELLGGHSGQTCRPHTQISVYGSMRRSMIDLFSSCLLHGMLRCGQYQDADQEEEEQKPLGHRQGSKHTI